MSGAHPVTWAREKRHKLRAMGPEWVTHTRAARDVSLPGVPLAAIAGFCANGSPYNTTGWRVGDEAEREAAMRDGRMPFKRARPDDRSVYGALTRSGDLHELGWFGTEAGKTPSPVATESDCPWVTLATSAEVRKVLGRDAVTGGAWYGALADQCAIGCANLARHLRAARRRLDPALQWDEAKPLTFWRWCCAMMGWSAGGRGALHVNAYGADLAPLPEGQRWAAFLRLAGAEDDDGNRHRQDEYSAIRTAQKIEAARLFAPELGEPWAVAWLDDGLTAGERAEVYARLVDVSRDAR